METSDTPKTVNKHKYALSFQVLCSLFFDSVRLSTYLTVVVQPLLAVSSYCCFIVILLSQLLFPFVLFRSVHFLSNFSGFLLLFHHIIIMKVNSYQVGKPSTVCHVCLINIHFPNFTLSSLFIKTHLIDYTKTKPSNDTFVLLKPETLSQIFFNYVFISMISVFVDNNDL